MIYGLPGLYMQIYLLVLISFNFVSFYFYFFLVLKESHAINVTIISD